MSRIVEAAEPAPPVPSALRRAFASFALLGESPGFSPIVLDRSELANLVGADHPFGITDRIVSDRDRLGELPAL